MGILPLKGKTAFPALSLSSQAGMANTPAAARADREMNCRLFDFIDCYWLLATGCFVHRSFSVGVLVAAYCK